MYKKKRRCSGLNVRLHLRSGQRTLMTILRLYVSDFRFMAAHILVNANGPGTHKCVYGTSLIAEFPFP